MTDILNTVAMLATIAFGAIGWLKPRYTMDKLDLATAGSELGLSEIRAANGALFVGLGVAALAIQAPIAFAMVGFGYLGAAIGRLSSLILDKSMQSTSIIFFVAEAVLAGWLIFANIAL